MFGTTTELVKLNDGESLNGPIGLNLGYADADLSLDSSDSQLLGFDPWKATVAFSLESLQDSVTVLFGSFDATAISVRLASNGYTRASSVDGGQIWTHSSAGSSAAGDGSSGATSSDGTFFLSSSRVAIGVTAAEVEAAVGSGTSELSADAELEQLAACLGSMQIAEVLPAAGLMGVSPQIATPVGAGARFTSAKDATFVLCVPTGSPAAAQALAAVWLGRVDSLSGKDGVRVSKLLTAPTSTVLGGSENIVRLSAKIQPKFSPDMALMNLEVGDYSSLIATPAAA